MKTKSRLLLSDKAWGTTAILLVLLQFWWLPGEAGSAADSYSGTVDGKLGLFRLLSELFPDVSRDSLSPVPESPCTLLLIGPDRLPTNAEERLLFEFVNSGGQLVFAPSHLEPEVHLAYLGITCERASWSPVLNDNLEVPPASIPSTPIPTTPVPLEKVEDTTTQDPAPVDPNAPELTPQPIVSEPVPTEVPKIDGARVMTSPLIAEPVMFRCDATVEPPYRFDSETLAKATSGEAVAALWRLGQGSVLVVSGPDLFSNRSLLFAENRRLVVRLLEAARDRVSDGSAAADPIVLAEYFNASDSFQQTGALFSPALRVASLQLLLAAVLGIWLAFHRFGPAEFQESLQRRSLVESAQAVGNLQYHIRDGGFVVRSYLDYLKSRIRGRYGSTLRIEDASGLAARSGIPEKEITEQLAGAATLANASSVSASRAAAMIRWLSRLHTRLSDSGRSSS